MTADSCYLRLDAVAAMLGLSKPAIWKAIASGRLPAPVYPSPRSPRWMREEIVAALAATRLRPGEERDVTPAASRCG